MEILLQVQLQNLLKSRRLLLMTNVEGVLDKEKKLIEEISSSGNFEK